MPEIMNLLACFSQCLEPTALRQRCRVIKALLSMSGRVTMRGMARYAGEGEVTGRCNMHSTVLIVPLVVPQVESNVLLHQEHPDFFAIQACEPLPVRWDRRLFRHSS